ncbi:MAG TPA: hypothetical protein DEF30_08155 [Proteiniclasticum sp.]|uniref:hypothetical protein n=1 Tax=Proteiniclasticum sp. TaxID=2053595 RepID=UPI000E8FC56B|nr:hypothetical protein [Proteiniclasticum sp.]HBW13773.1 hypothetical protein [Proteiniclasticum sp.]
MDYGSYIEYLQHTIKKYSQKQLRFILKKMIKAEIAYSGQVPIQLSKEEAMDITDMVNELALLKILKESKKGVKEFENWEIIKDYKYSIPFEIDNYESIVPQIMMNSQTIDTTEENHTHKELGDPIKYTIDDMDFLKYCFSFSAYNSTTGKEELLKYPVVIVFHNTIKIIEIRFDTLLMPFKNNNPLFYSNLVKLIRSDLKDRFNITLIPIDLMFLHGIAKENKSLKLIGQSMNLSSGGRAELSVGNNEDYILPFIGELVDIIKDHADDLRKYPDLEDALKNFIYEIEEMSDYPWFELLWENETKTRSIHVKVVTRYMNEDYCLIQHYYSNVLIGMERMDHVIKYISSNRASSK